MDAHAISFSILSNYVSNICRFIQFTDSWNRTTWPSMTPTAIDFGIFCISINSLVCSMHPKKKKIPH